MKITEKRMIVMEMEYQEFAHLVNLIAELKMDKEFKKNNNSYQKSLKIVESGLKKFKA